MDTIRNWMVRLAAVAAVSGGPAFAQMFGVSMPSQQVPVGNNNGDYALMFADTAMGDITGDGVDDMLFTYHDLTGQHGHPDVRIQGARDGASFQYLTSHSHVDPTPASYNWWGKAICVIGDIDGDGVNEYAVGDSGANIVYVYWGDPSASVFGDDIVCTIEALLPAPPQGDGSNPSFGYSLAAGGDINNDGIPDLLVGDRSVQTSGDNNVRIGAVYVFSGHELKEAWKDANATGDPTLRQLDVTVNIGKITMVRQLTGVQYLGEELAGGVDADGDGCPDILIRVGHEDWNVNPTDPRSGVVLFSGCRYSRPIHTYVAPPAYAQGATAKSTFGSGISFVLDIQGAGPVENQEGNDVLIGYPGDHLAGDPGHAFVFSSSRLGDLLEVHAGVVDAATGLGSSMGAGVASAGLADNGNRGDYWVAEPRHNPDANGDYQGNVFLVSGGTGIYLPPNAPTRLDEQFGATTTSQHGRLMSSSGLHLVYTPGQSFTSPGFTCFSDWPAGASDFSLTSSEYH